MVITRPTAEVAPLDAASNTLALLSLKRHVHYFEGPMLSGLFGMLVLMMSSYTFILMSLSSLTWEVSVSGQKVLAMAREAGADMTVDVSTCVALTSKRERDDYFSVMCFPKNLSLAKGRNVILSKRTHGSSPRGRCMQLTWSRRRQPSQLSLMHGSLRALTCWYMAGPESETPSEKWKRKKIKRHPANFLIVISVMFFFFLATCPRNIVPAATTDSTGVVPMVTCIT